MLLVKILGSTWVIILVVINLMNACKKNGECLLQDDNGEYSKNGCCEPVKCANYKHCKELIPKWVLDCNYGMCMNCAACKYSKYLKLKALFERKK